MNHVTQLLLVALVALSGAATIVEDLPVPRDITTFFALGGLIGGVVYRAERAAYQAPRRSRERRWRPSRTRSTSQATGSSAEVAYAPVGVET